jgi:ubiquitin carboxyl-terminal hydrolase 5/13
VRYTTRVEDYIPLPIPLSAAENLEAVQNYEKLKSAVEAMGQKVPDEEKVRPVIPFDACIQAFIQEEEVR